MPGRLHSAGCDCCTCELDRTSIGPEVQLTPDPGLWVGVGYALGLLAAAVGAPLAAWALLRAR